MDFIKRKKLEETETSKIKTGGYLTHSQEVVQESSIEKLNELIKKQQQNSNKKG